MWCGSCVYYNNGMTMKRNAKNEALSKVRGIYDGSIEVLSQSPRQVREHGKYLPARVAAPQSLRISRIRTGETHILKAESREMHEMLTTDRHRRAARKVTRRG